MKSERYFKRNLFKKIVKFCVFSTILTFGLTFIMGFYYEPNIYVKLNNVTIELGSELPEEITKYKNILTDNSGNLVLETGAPLDEDGKTKMIGTFPYYLVYNDNNYKFSRLTNVKSTITVIDTVKPEITVKENVKIAYGSKLSVSDIAECFDLSGCKMRILEEVDTTKSGKYDLSIIATDGGKNESTAIAKITILEKPKPVYTYQAYNGSFNNMNNHNNQINAKLSEEGKASLRNELVSFARQFVGNPYVYGGTSLTKGADCSGFTMSVYANFGYSLPRGSSDQAYIGTPVSASALLPGDLVVYSGHVGIYAGNGMMVHASTPQGGIKYAPVYDGYRVYRRIIL